MLAITVGEVGISKIGQLRNLFGIMTSSSSLGTFNGVLKYVSEFKDDKSKLKELFSTVFTFLFIGSFITSIIIFFSSSFIANTLFGNDEFTSLIKVLALMAPTIGINRVFSGVINGLSEYKKLAKIELSSYLISAVMLVTFLCFFKLEGVLFSIVLTPITQLGIIIYVFGSTLKQYMKFKIGQVPFLKEILAFTLMSFVSTVLLNYIELDIRTMISNKISVDEAGYWTAMSFISKNYMAFSSSLFTLYVIPKFSRIYLGQVFVKEVFNIYKTLLPIFGLGMILVYVFRNFVIDIIYPNFTGMESLFKWQLLGDFVRLATLVISHQFLAKKMVKSFIITELISLALFYSFSKYFVILYGAEGVVMAHFFRYIIYFLIVTIAVWLYFKKQKNRKNYNG
ncbi:MAG: oligosaccharide flippase family protein [Algibacter sp.]